MNLAGRLETVAARAPDRPALLAGPSSLTYGELERRASQLAGGLRRHGVERGDRVAVVWATGAPDAVAAMYGLWKLGAIVVALNAQLTPSEIGQQLGRCGVRLAVVEPGTARTLVEAAALAHAGLDHVVEPGDLLGEPVCAERLGPEADATIFFTSGTTGSPKGATHTHRSLLTHLEMLASWYRVGRDDVVLQALPLYLLSVLIMGPLLALHVGAPCRLLPRFDSVEVARWVTSDRVTVMGAVPVLLWDLLELDAGQAATFDLSPLRVLHIGGAPTSQDLRARFEERFGARLYHAFGATESPSMVSGDPHLGRRKPRGVGRALPHIAVTVVDDDERPVPAGTVGEVCASPRVSGPHAGRYEPLRCYWGEPAETAHALRGGRFHFGDLGYLDDEGHLFIVDRMKDLIIRGGMNISPRELEDLLRDDERIAECAVVGAPHPRYGEVPVAYVRVSGSPPPTGPDVLALVNRRSARYKHLTDVIFVQDFPRNAMGKILKRELVSAQMSQHAQLQNRSRPDA